MLAEPVVADVTLARRAKGTARVYALDPLTGERRRDVPVHAGPDGHGVAFAIGGEYATIYYEVTFLP